MHDRGHPMLLQHALDQRAVGEVALDERAPLHRPLVPVHEVVEHHGLEPSLGHALGGLATDVASPADYEDRHDEGLLPVPCGLDVLHDEEVGRV